MSNPTVSTLTDSSTNPTISCRRLEAHMPGSMAMHCRQEKPRQATDTRLDHMGLSLYQCCCTRRKKQAEMAHTPTQA